MEKKTIRLKLNLRANYVLAIFENMTNMDMRCIGEINRGLFVVILLLCFGVEGMGQLVNIESKRMQTDSIRFALKGDLLFNYNSNNGNEVYNAHSNVVSQIKSKDLNKILFVLGSYSLIRTSEEDFVNAWLGHLRYNHELTNLFRLEAFIQSQENRLLKIDSRNLIGAGLRLKFISTNDLRAYLGISYMYELEESSKAEISNYNHRHSSYLSISYTHPNSKLTFTNTVYFQPLYRELANHRILQQLKIEVPLNSYLSFSSLFNYFYMSETPLEGTDEVANFRVGLSIRI